jgi:hypothetical protein
VEALCKKRYKPFVEKKKKKKASFRPLSGSVRRIHFCVDKEEFQAAGFDSAPFGREISQFCLFCILTCISGWREL